MDKKNVLAAFSALSQETRLDVLRLLIRRGETGALSGEIGDALGVKQNTMSANLTVLLQSDLVRNTREGRGIRYFANMNAIAGLIGFLMEDCCGGRPELCRPILTELTEVEC